MKEAVHPPCRNCGRPAGPRFCGHCGQRVEERRLPVHVLLWDLVAEWLSVDGKVLRTLRALARPGRLTHLYLAGKRAPYVRPMRLYVVASVVLFSSLLNLQAPRVGEIEFFIGGDRVVAPQTPREGERRVVTLDAGDSWLVHWWVDDFDATLERLRRMPPQELLNQLFAGLRRFLPVALIVFLPFLALALKLLYLRSEALYVDHLVFAAHFQSALFLALSIAWLLTRLLSRSLVFSIVLYTLVGLSTITVYLFLALRRVYRQSRRRTVVKLLALLFIYGQLLRLALGLPMLMVVLHLEP